MYILFQQIIEDNSLKNGFHQDLCTAIDSDGSPLHQDTHISRPDSPSRSANLQIIAQNLDFSFWESDSPFGRSQSRTDSDSTSSQCAKYFFGQFSKVYESARQTREPILAKRWESMSAAIPDLAGSLSFHRFCFKKEKSDGKLLSTKIFG